MPINIDVAPLNLLDAALAGGDWNNDNQPLWLHNQKQQSSVRTENLIFGGQGPCYPLWLSHAGNMGCYPNCYLPVVEVWNQMMLTEVYLQAFPWKQQTFRYTAEFYNSHFRQFLAVQLLSRWRDRVLALSTLLSSLISLQALLIFLHSFLSLFLRLDNLLSSSSVIFFL